MRSTPSTGGFAHVVRVGLHSHKERSFAGGLAHVFPAGLHSRKTRSFAYFFFHGRRVLYVGGIYAISNTLAKTNIEPNPSAPTIILRAVLAYPPPALLLVRTLNSRVMNPLFSRHALCREHTHTHHTKYIAPCDHTIRTQESRLNACLNHTHAPCALTLCLKHPRVHSANKPHAPGIQKQINLERYLWVTARKIGVHATNACTYSIGILPCINVPLSYRAVRLTSILLPVRVHIRSPPCESHPNTLRASSLQRHRETLLPTEVTWRGSRSIRTRYW